jgi:protein-tyrosine-phosphatase
MTTRTRVLILCTANSAQSQMAEGLLRHGQAEMPGLSGEDEGQALEH